MPIGAPPGIALDPFSVGIAPGTNTIFDFYLGQPSVNRTNPHAARNVTTWNMDEAYEGKSLALKDTIMDWMWTANQTFYTEWCLPWQQTDDIYVEWQVFENKAHIVGLNPHQAAARNISQGRYTRRAALVRRGISFQIEHDWAKTALGRQSIMMGMGIIARSWQETANAEVIRALLHAGHWYQQYVRDNGIVTRLDHVSSLRRQRDYFAYFQKTKNGAELWDTKTDEECNRYHGKFDTIIMPANMYSYITMVPPEKTDYYLRGPKGPAAIDGKGGWTMPAPRIADNKEPARWLSQKRVYQARAYHVEGTDPVELLSKPTQMGEYNWMTDEHCKYDDGCYVSAERDIQIYDEMRDSYQKVTLKAALDNCQLFDESGKLKPVMLPEQGGVTPEIQRDFLTRVLPDGSVEPVRVLGDIGNAFITTTMLDKMAETLLCREFRGRPTEREAAEKNANTPPFTAPIKSMFSDNLIIQSPYAMNALFGDSSSVSDTQPLPAEIHESLVALGAQVVPGADALAQRRLGAEIKKATTLRDLRANVTPYLEQNCIGERAAGFKFQSADQIRTWFHGTLNDVTKELKGSDSTVERRLPESAAALGLFREHQRSEQEYDAGYDDDVPQYTGSRFQPVGTVYGFGDKGQGLEAMQQRREKPRAAFQNLPPNYNTDVGSDGMFDYHIGEIQNSGMSELKKSRAILLLASPINRKFFESCIQNNILFPMNFLLLRPHATYRGRTCIKMLGGGLVGNTYIGHQSAEIGHDAARMISTLHSVAYMAAIVKEAQHVYCEPNLYVDEYQGGLGMQFFSPASYMRRSPEGDRGGASIVVVAVPYTEREFPNPLDIAGRYYTDYTNPLVEPGDINELHYSTAYRYNDIYNFYTRNNQRDEVSQPTVVPHEVHMNRICWSGAQMSYNRISGKFEYYVHNTSGWGELVYPGCGRVRNGGDLMLDPTKMSSMLAAF